MKEILGNIWDCRREGWVAVTTNGVVKRDGSCVMGRGVALQAKQRFPRLPYELGRLIQQLGNRVFAFPKYQLYSLPVKYHWREKADLDLIVFGCHRLAAIVPPERTVYMVRPGCGAGGLSWEVVRVVIAPILDDRFVVVELPRR